MNHEEIVQAASYFLVGRLRNYVTPINGGRSLMFHVSEFERDFLNYLNGKE